MALDQFEKSVWVSRAITASSSVGITHTWSQVAIRGFYKWRSFSPPWPSPPQVLPSLHRWSDSPLYCRWGPKEQVSLIQESCEFGQKSGGCSVVQLSMSSTPSLVRSSIDYLIGYFCSPRIFARFIHDFSPIPPVKTTASTPPKGTRYEAIVLEETKIYTTLITSCLDKIASRNI